MIENIEKTVMPSVEIEGRKMGLDEEDFLLNHDDWGRDAAEALAKHEEGPDALSDPRYATRWHRKAAKNAA